MPRPTVQEAARRLREGGLIQTGGVGRYGGADMTPEEAAALLTAILILRAASASLSDIVRLTRSHLRDLRSHSGDPGAHFVLDTWDQKLALPQLCGLKRGHAFGDALTAIIASISNGDIKQAIADWASSRPNGVAPFFAFTARINGPRPHSEARIEFDTAAFGLELIYLRPRDAKGLTLPAATRKLRDLLELKPHGLGMVVTATASEQILAEIGHLLSEGT
jgi:hypothetical protein